MSAVKALPAEEVVRQADARWLQIAALNSKAITLPERKSKKMEGTI
ncbi:MAG: hypothetical protein KAS69_04150 [Planctomycetes bacterium]|nr:hypothetical protein [Planctomycetota bacterium]